MTNPSPAGKAKPVNGNGRWISVVGWVALILSIIGTGASIYARVTMLEQRVALLTETQKETNRELLEMGRRQSAILANLSALEVRIDRHEAWSNGERERFDRRIDKIEDRVNGNESRRQP